MALDAVVYPQDPFCYYGYKDCYGGGGHWGYDIALQEDDKAFLGILEDNNNNIEQQQATGFQANWDSSSPPIIQRHAKDYHQWEYPNSSPETCTTDNYQSLSADVLHPTSEPPPPPTTTGRRKRRRTKNPKDKEEIENQRMTHIAVERNRRKRMNEYLAVLRSLMPPSYVQRGDQASIIGGAINFVKELEQLLQTMEGHKKTKQQQPDASGFSSSPFADFFTFPQYSTRNPPTTAEESLAVADQNQWAMADIEVTMVENHANLKILSKRRPRKLLKVVAGLQGLRLSVLHLNVTTADQMVLYSVSVKIEEGCLLNTVDDIAAAVNQVLHTIHEEEATFS
ncbi:DNA binding protein, putative [Ricinus communis]|uniref:DNA binding protein, putative n=1 Tax=Ricinus communis TaxID=3988 RepID=B9RJR6_RICCO|nr:DNA binding protein, putative [Ricinus communis]|eukprot:XP_002513985.1 transcription factor bHLH96 [Ricinus communis]